MKVILLGIATFLFGCQEVHQDKGALRMELKFPKGLKTHPQRFYRFKKQVIFLRLEIEDRGKRYRFNFPPNQWNQIKLNEISEVSPRTQFWVEIWDRHWDGRPRDKPSFTGHKQLTQNHIESKRVQIFLRAQVPLQNY